ncbi:MAG: 50S ribosomal protein L7/L12 [Gemmataceae bacterium]
MAVLGDLVHCLDIKDLADRIMNLSLAEAAALRVHLEEVHGIRPAVGISSVKQQAETESPETEPVSFAVVLQGLVAPEKKISVFKAVREVANLGLKETRELVESAPATIKTNLLKDEAAVVKKKLEDAGARVVIVPVCEG